MSTAVAIRSPTADEISSLPHNEAAEQALLGCVLFDNAALERVDGILKPEHFFEPFHARLYAAIESSVHKGLLAEPIMLLERFKNDESFGQLGGLRYLADLVDRAPPAFGAGGYARIVCDLALRRALITLADDMGHGARDGEGTGAEQLADAEQRLFSLAETGKANGGFIGFEETLTRSLAATSAAYERDGGLSGLSTGLMDLDAKLGGLHGSDLIILAARPSMGKTALGTNIAFHVARNYAWTPNLDGSHRTTSGGVVGFFSLEMSEEQLGNRILAEVAGVPSDRMRKGMITPPEYGRIRDAAIEIQASPLYMDATGAIAVGKLAARARRLKRTSGLDLIVVDYLQLVTAQRNRSDGRVQEVSEVTQALKALAKELSVPVLALAQLSRQVEQRDDKRPQLSDLRESGSIEQDADVVMFLFREEYYLARAEPKENSAEHDAWRMEMDRCRGKAELIIGKQRHGPIGTIKLAFHEDLTKFSTLAREGRYDNSPTSGYRDPQGGDR